MDAVGLLIKLGRAGGVPRQIVQTLCDACFHSHVISIQSLNKRGVGGRVDLLRYTTEWNCELSFSINLREGKHISNIFAPNRRQ